MHLRQRQDPVIAVDPRGAGASEARSEQGRASVALSVIVPMFQDRADVAEVYEAYKAAIERIGRPYELIYVLSWQSGRALAALKQLKQRGEDALVLVLGQQLNEAEALLIGFEHARGDIVLTLPADPQVDPADIPQVVAALDHCDVAVGRRPPTSSRLQQIQANAFHRLLKLLFGHSFTDLVCRVRAWRRPVTEEISLHGVQPHFLPLLASERGFRIAEVDVRSGTTGRAGVKLTLFERIGVALDIFALYLVLKFTKKPLRFFGMIGLPILLLGAVGCVGLAVARLAYGMPLADRPALVLAVLLVVLGIQIVALGLIGELVIFASGRRIKEHSIERIL
jgi:glycosyltransferase involved in cell wall biosynthesis